MASRPVRAAYLDSSALVKLVVREAETDALAEFLDDWPLRFSSVLAAVEVPRAANRSGADAITAVADVLEVVNLIEVDMRVVETAAALAPSALRTLDAIHLASAVSLGDDVAGLVTYDERLANAATSAGLQVLAPI